MLSTANEYVGINGASGFFQQTAGSNTTTSLTILPTGYYQLTGGTLRASGTISNRGVINGGNSPSTLYANSILDMTSGTWENMQGTSVNMGAGSLLIVPSGFNTSTQFASYNSLGLTHTAGTTLTIPAGMGFSGQGTISDPVVCQGSISATALTNGLVISGTGTVNVGGLIVNDLSSGMASGSLNTGISGGIQYVGSSGTGQFAQSGGANSQSLLYLGYKPSDVGTYTLGTSSSLTVGVLYVGYSGSGNFVQSEGTNNVSTIANDAALYLGYLAGSKGTYNLSGSGTLILGYNAATIQEDIGYYGTAIFNQSGGTHSVGTGLSVGFEPGSSGIYNLSGSGVLSAYTLYVGNYSNSGGTCSISDSGSLSTTYEYIGASAGTSALLQQTGGLNSVNFLTVGGGGRYLLAGGTLQLKAPTTTGGGPYSSSIINQGIIDGEGSPGALIIAGSTILDLTAGSWENLGETSVVVGPNSLFIVPQGFDTSTDFGSYSSLGITHTLGTTLVVPAGKGFAGGETITDPVNCQGTIRGLGMSNLNLQNGLILSGSGSVNIANLTVNDPNSGMSGGLLLTSNQYIGYSGSGSFNQTGGTNSPGLALYLGYKAGDYGTYLLSNSGLLTGAGEEIGWNGSGSFAQSGGTNSATSLYTGANFGTYGAYTLSSSGRLSAPYEYSGWYGTGLITQSGGTNTVTSDLYIGYYAGSSGTYSLNGGLLILAGLGSGSGSSSFTFSGGTWKAGASYATNQPIALGTGGSGATFDTAGYSLTLSGSLSGPGGFTKVDSGTLTLGTSNTYSGNTLIAGGTLTLGNPLALQNSTLDTSGGGALSFGALTAATFGGLTGPGQLSTANSTSNPLALSVGSNDSSTTYSGVLSGAGSLTKTGSGILTVTGSNTYTGPTAINQGAMIVNGSLASPVTVNSGGVLSGTGSVGSVTVNAGGQLAPGNAPGTLNVGGPLTLATSAVMDYELGSLGDSDEVLMPGGALNLNGQQFSDFNFTALAGFGPGEYTLIDAASINGQLGTNRSGTIDGLPANLAIDNDNLVLTVVPEPSSLALLLVATLAAIAVGWKRRSALRQ